MHSQSGDKRRKFLPALCALVLAAGMFGITLKHTAIAEFLWSNWRLSGVAMFFDPQSAELWFEMGNYHFGGSKEFYDIEKAERAFKRAVLLDPAFPGAHYQLARVYFIKGDFYSAITEINKEIALYPDFAKSYYMKGLIDGYSGNLGLAAKDFEEFLKYKPDSWAAHNDLAWAYFRLGDYEKVKEVAANGLRYSPNNPWLNNSLGIALMNLGEKEAAKVALLRAQQAAKQLTVEQCGSAYPGNDPRIYEQGLEAMRSSIRENLALLGDGNAE